MALNYLFSKTILTEEDNPKSCGIGLSKLQKLEWSKLLEKTITPIKPITGVLQYFLARRSYCLSFSSEWRSKGVIERGGWREESIAGAVSEGQGLWDLG